MKKNYIKPEMESTYLGFEPTMVQRVSGEDGIVDGTSGEWGDIVIGKPRP